jgi:hypothetical protein
MVSTSVVKETLTTDEWVSLSPDAACANRSRGIPGQEDSFTVERSSNQGELEKLIPILDRSGVHFEVRQAAIWIVTDDADYGDLGILVKSYGPIPFGGGPRAIQENETARAMKICEEAGIDITQKAIWQDREQILKGLTDENLGKWLQTKK